MLQKIQLPLDETVNLLKAAGEQTRLRLLWLLSHGDLTVTDLMDILGQSQPRISRHLKLLGEAGLLERYQEGAWAYFRVVDEGPQSAFVREILSRLATHDSQLQMDLARLEGVRSRRAQRAADYFSRNAESWDELRRLHVDDKKVEAAMLEMIGNTPVNSMLDLGTGTGRMLELFRDLYARGTGIDGSHDMLEVARANLDKADIQNAQVRLGDLMRLALPQDGFDLITIHQVLHYLDNPQHAIGEAARALGPGGRLLVADFAPHDLEFLREKHAHLRLGFAAEQVSGWLEAAGLEVTEVRKLGTDENSGNGQKLVVTLWLARDTRMLIA
ncbi:MAG: metalloregulator ArsR/SmtB family transcription factor [Nitratireductor sp.]|nr:metalloregulator ArsR/SmtB family transcription factor [Nitratireductor sp.]MCC0022304.1 metalloregulator ArsR/SmtB family transcription factor [Nitratireductor sp.]